MTIIFDIHNIMLTTQIEENFKKKIQNAHTCVLHMLSSGLSTILHRISREWESLD
jgi:hypothetical protein